MSRRDIKMILIGIVCGGAVVSGGMLVSRSLHQVELVATKPNSQPPQRDATRPAAKPLSYGLDGFCPVTLIEKRKWTLGNTKYREMRGTQVFVFAGSAEYEQFQQDPDRYLPAFSGNDVVLSKEGGETTTGMRQHGIVYDDHIYLFANEESLQRFSENPGLYVTPKGDHSVDSGA